MIEFWLGVSVGCMVGLCIGVALGTWMMAIDKRKEGKKR